MKKLLLIVPNLQLGGQERVAVNTAHILGKDFNLKVVIFDDADQAFASDAEIVNLNIPAKKGIISKCVNLIKRAYALHKLRKQELTDYSISFGTTANIANVMSLGLGQSVISIRGFNSIKQGFSGYITYRLCDKVICCSKVIRDTLLEKNAFLNNKIHVLYNPYSIKQLLLRGAEPVADYAFSPHTIISHGRLEEVKNYPRLIKAFYLVKKQIPDAQLLIIGEGAYRDTLENLIRKYSLADSVTLLGFRNNPFAYISKSYLYVLPSFSEGFPNALVEGMCFLPVVAADCPSGPREILSTNTLVHNVCSDIELADYGILVKPVYDYSFSESIVGDDHLLADAIVRYLIEDKLYTKYKALAFSRAEKFSYESYRNRLINILFDA